VATRTRPWRGAEWETNLVNHNKLLGSYEGAIGVKNGYTSEAGQCLVAAAARGEEGYLAVALNSSSRELYADVTALLDYAFDNFQAAYLVQAGQVIARVATPGGKDAKLVAAGNYRYLKQADSQWPVTSLKVGRLVGPVAPGDKVAIGPHEYGVDWKQTYLNYQARYFLRSRYFLTIRTPSESLWSMHKLFPWASIPKLIETWLQSLALVIDVYRVCPNSHLLFFDHFGPATIDRVSEIIAVQLPVPASMLGSKYIYSRLDEGELPAPLAPFADLCRECIDVYEELRANVCPQQFRYNGSMHEGAFFARLHVRMLGLLERSQASTNAHKAA